MERLSFFIYFMALGTDQSVVSIERFRMPGAVLPPW
jgi:hypothetical protein